MDEAEGDDEVPRSLASRVWSPRVTSGSITLVTEGTKDRDKEVRGKQKGNPFRNNFSPLGRTPLRPIEGRNKMCYWYFL